MKISQELLPVTDSFFFSTHEYLDCLHCVSHLDAPMTVGYLFGCLCARGMVFITRGEQSTNLIRVKPHFSPILIMSYNQWGVKHRIMCVTDKHVS